MAQKIITVILALAVIGGLAWYFNKTYLQPSESHSTEKVPQFKTSSTDENFKGKLIYATTGATKEIWAIDAKKESKKLFTDSDEAEKILEISNLASISNEILVITSTETSSSSGKLVAINLSSSKETVLQKPFSLPPAWTVSLDGQKIAYTRFSNIEENYGFTLYSSDRSGTNLRELIRSDQEIKVPVWNENATKIAFVKNVGSKSQLNVVDVNSLKEKEVKSFEGQIIDSLSFSGDKLVFSVRDLSNKSSGTIKIIGSNGQNLEKMADFEGGVANFVYMENSSWLGFLIAQYKDKINSSTTGQIYIENLKKLEKIPLAKGSQILGWQNE
ncbi:MAG: Protein TolB [Berkelbacteria bacterium GW2011_GWA1_36_9]|uniref:Protein TolB n=1 Tax=Berkelbacteria bacterium GW2011_GWA1_36_9 TaxID=1618331 RepID=A0A0G0I1U6_9BACT|nr:MAG: Protein TolB [Berkelbacteria bacterium GW2011_GWA1_36_9]